MRFFTLLSFSIAAVAFRHTAVPLARAATKRQATTATPAASVKDTISALKTCNLTRTDLNELVLSLEKTNPTDKPAESKLVNGVWNLAYSGYGTPGLIAFQAIKALLTALPFTAEDGSKLVDAEDLTITISSVQPRVEASTKLKVGPGSVEVVVISELESTGPGRLTETFVSAQIGSLKDIKIPGFIKKNYTREVIVTYLDEDLLIVRDVFNSPEILMRQSMDFLPSSETSVEPIIV